MNAQDPEMEEQEDDDDDNGSRKQNSTSSSGEMDIPHDHNVIVIELLCETDDICKSRSVSIPNKYAEDHLPSLSPGKSKMLEFEDCFSGNNFRMEFVHTNFGDYYLRTGWERYRDEHKLEYGDFISFYKKSEKQNGSEDLVQYSYVIYCWKQIEKDEPEDTPIEPMEIVPVLVKNLCVKDLYGNRNGVRLPKKQVEENFIEIPLPKVGEQIILPLFDSIGRKHFIVQLVHAEQEDEYYIRGKGWEEYVAKHNLLIFDTIFVNKIVFDSSAEDQLVNISYFYEITYQTRATKPKILGTTMQYRLPPASTTTTTTSAVDNSSAPDSTTTNGENNSMVTNGLQRIEPEYDSDDAYWL